MYLNGYELEFYILTKACDYDFFMYIHGHMIVN